MLSNSQPNATIPVQDIDTARSFYRDTLGLDLVEERSSELRFRCARETTFGVFVSQGRASGTHTQMVFMCDDVDAEVADLRARGIVFEELDMPGVEGRDGVYELEGERGAWFRDPDGNLLAVAQLTDS